jgi:hypothetical protein
MAGFTTLNESHLMRSDIWTRQIRELLMDDLIATRFVKQITDFPDGKTLHIPSMGEAETSDFAEGQAIKYNKMDTGEFLFEFDQYKYSAHAISEKFKRDSYYASDVVSAFVPRQHRALMEAVETRIFSRGPAGQAPNDLNTINTAPHRFVGGGTAESIALDDFSMALFALTKANVPLTDLVAILDPTVAYTIQTQTNLVNLMTPAPQWQNIVNSGLVTGMKFRFNLFGFDCYVSNYLPRGFTDTIDGKTVSNGVANQFFSATPGDTLPYIGGFRQMPTVYSEFNKDLQQEEYLTIAEYGYKLYRPENLVVVLTDLDVVG